MTSPDYPLQENAQFVDPDQIREHLELIFAGVEWTRDRLIGIRGIGEKGTFKEAHHREDDFNCPLYDSDPMTWAASHAERWAQWHVATFIVPCVLKARKGTAENVELFSCVLVDLDDGNTDERLAWLQENVAPPTMVIASGGVTDCGTAKRHVYFGLTEPTADVRAVVTLRDTLARKAGGDISMGLGVEGNPFGRAHQPIRIAGTCHAKDGMAKACHILERNPEAVYNLSALALLAAAAPKSPWAIEDRPAVTTVPSAQGAFSFQPERPSDTTRALNTDVFEGGTDRTRWGVFSEVAGFHLSCARRGNMTVEKARADTMGWMEQHMIPPWPPERANAEFDGLLAVELRKGGPIAAPAPPIVSEAEAFLGLRKWAAHRWITEPKPHHEFLVDKLVIKKEPHLFVAEGGAGKTYLVADLAMKVAAHGRVDGELEWCGRKILNGGTAVVILCEDSETEMHIRFLELDAGRGLIAAGHDRLIVMPMNSMGGTFSLAERDPKTGGSVIGKKWNEIMGLLGQLPNLALVIIDTLNSVAHGEENSAVVIAEMMREANKVCGTLGAALVINHHVRKSGAQEVVNSMEDLKEAIRGSSAIPSYFRVNFGMFQATDYVRRMKAMGLKPEKGALWRFGIVKCNINGLMRDEKTLLRNAHGLLEDVTERDTFNQVNMAEREAWLVLAVRIAAENGHPYTNTGKNSAGGLYRRRAELPPLLRMVGPGEFTGLVDEALGKEVLVLSSVKGSQAKSYLDVQKGNLADNEVGEELVKGAYSPPDWSVFSFNPIENNVTATAERMPVPFQPVAVTDAAPVTASAEPAKRLMFSPERQKTGIERGLVDD